MHRDVRVVIVLSVHHRLQILQLLLKLQLNFCALMNAGLFYFVSFLFQNLTFFFPRLKLFTEKFETNQLQNFSETFNIIMERDALAHSWYIRSKYIATVSLM